MQTIVLTILVAVVTLSICGGVLGLKPCCSPDRVTVEVWADQKLSTSYIDHGRDLAIELWGGKNGLDYEIFDEGNNLKYIRFSDGTCKKFPFPHDRYYQCIPSDATSFDVPPVGGDAMAGFRYNIHGEAFDLVVKADDCIPQYMTITKPGISPATYYYRNVVPTINDNTVFDKDLSDCQF